MGGGGTYYARDVTDRSRRTEAGYTYDAQQAMSQKAANPATSPRNRRIACNVQTPICYLMDGTGSMGKLPKIMWDKWPMVAGQIMICEYLHDPMISMGVVGDVPHPDDAPLQICDFTPFRGLDEQMERLWLEGKGGPGYRESYEFGAYFYVHYVDMPNATLPICLFTGDEAFREKIHTRELQLVFGEGQENVESREVFEQLKQKFMGNVFLIHRRYRGAGADESVDQAIVEQWERVLGAEKVIKLGSDLAIADVTLGVFALVSGARTLEQYLEDMRSSRDEPQTQGRIEEVRRTLLPLESIRNTLVRPQTAEDQASRPGRLF